MRLRKRWIKVMLAALLGFSLVLPANAEERAVIDETRNCSLTIYKYDRTKAADEGVEKRFSATGEADPEAEHCYAAYAMPGVEFSCLRIGEADIRTSAEAVSGSARVEVLYGLDESVKEQITRAGILSLQDIEYTRDGCSYVSSDTLTGGLTRSFSERPTATRDILESYVRRSGQKQCSVTDERGRAFLSDLTPGLYLVAETEVPEDVVSTVEPFLVSLPATNRGGDEWIYDVTVYPKNRTGSPELAKEVAEISGEEEEAGNYGTSASASEGDRLSYRITSRMPTITSASTYLTEYTFLDSLSGGISYCKGDVSLAWYGADGDLKEVWRQTEDSALFTVAYEKQEDGGEAMRIALTRSGLSAVNHVFSDGKVEITYQARFNSDKSAICGDLGNPNRVELTWRRTNQDFYDTLQETCRVYTYGLALEKRFQTGEGDFEAVRFRLRNRTDGYYVTAREEERGCYYVTGAALEAEGATEFSPDFEGKFRIFGLEEDSYELRETKTAEGYLLLKEAIHLSITAEEDGREWTGAASVNGEAMEMIPWEGSEHALASVLVVNQPGYRIPLTGDDGMFFLPVAGLTAGAFTLILLLQIRKKRSEKETE
ncbi:MAG: SpaH/EbpB family LPXTG-anchored major pilin [Lachnospiraceae bacterium]|nr:SpaH/EbpB family LPXTG-anchored major pilin [Lachnospiraceae bacterium]